MSRNRLPGYGAIAHWVELEQRPQAEPAPSFDVLFNFISATGPMKTTPFRDFAQEVARKVREIAREEHLEQLTKRIDILESCTASASCIIVPVQNFDPEEYVAEQPIYFVVRPDDGAYLASYFDARVHAAGDTQDDAVGNLKSLILDLRDSLCEISDEELGPIPLMQKRLLCRAIKVKE
jgi:hypothetical protein